VSTPNPTPIYVEAAPVSLPLAVERYTLAGHVCPTCDQAHLGPRADLTLAAAVTCCWCAKHGEQKYGNSCWVCVQENAAAWQAQAAEAPPQPLDWSLRAVDVLDDHPARDVATPEQREALQALLDGWVASIKAEP
jgi:hypothetical protein